MFSTSICTEDHGELWSLKPWSWPGAPGGSKARAERPADGPGRRGAISLGGSLQVGPFNSEQQLSTAVKAPKRHFKGTLEPVGYLFDAISKVGPR